MRCFALLVLLALLGCAQSATPNQAQERVVASAHFGQIRKGDSMEKVEALVGPPTADIGSGAWIYVYQRPDGTNVAVAFNPNRTVAMVTGTYVVDGRRYDVDAGGESEKP